MSISPAVLDAMVAAGASAEVIVAAIKADAQQDADRQEAKRANNAERQRRFKAKNAQSNADNALPGVSNGYRVTDAPIPLDGPPKEISNPPLNPPTPVIVGRAKPKPNDEFARFWAVYPKRVGKRDAEKAHAAAIKRGTDPEIIVASAARYAADPPDDPQFIPHPATWLNRGSYDDEPTACKSKEVNNGNSIRSMAGRASTGQVYRANPALDWIRRNGDAFDADEGSQGVHSGTGFALPARS